MIDRSAWALSIYLWLAGCVPAPVVVRPIDPPTPGPAAEKLVTDPQDAATYAVVFREIGKSLPQLEQRREVFDVLSLSTARCGLTHGKYPKLSEAVGSELKPIESAGDATGRPVTLTDGDRKAVAEALERLAGRVAR
ncbi:MAG: hypothetical protein NT069_25900 [Planctomycetota bacterium]|nr:hypothetical protein [Planctomycetota bacterium]